MNSRTDPVYGMQRPWWTLVVEPLKRYREQYRRKCPHKNTEAYFMGGSEYDVTCKDCGATL